MIWLNPAALFALAAAAAPVLIHLLVHRRAERFPFPTLRFLQPTRLASIRRHLLEDLPLLAVRVTLLAAAVAALAGPLLVTPSRREAWDRRVVRAVVRDSEGADLGRPMRAGQAAPLHEETFVVTSLADGIRRATLWLDAAPPARREIVIASSFPIGSITQADVAAIPADAGVRFERTATLPATRTLPAGRLLTPDGVRAREVTLAGDRTSVRDAAVGDSVSWPIDVVSSQAERPEVEAAIAAVLSQRVWAGPADRRVRLVLTQPAAVDADLKVRTTSEPVQAFPLPLGGKTDELRRGSPKPLGEVGRPAERLSAVAPPGAPWMAAAIARIAGDRDLRDAAARVTAGLSDAAFSAPPWQSLASAADGRPLAAAAGSPNGIVVVSAARASDAATPLLLRSIANAIGAVPDLQRAEVVPIADDVLQRWSRPAAPLRSPRIETVDQDDRRWPWIATLCLLALEMWIRRARAAETSQERREEDARVA
jgi:hypothetical protein